MLYITEAPSQTEQHSVYPFGPPVAGAIPIASVCAETLDSYAVAVQCNEALLPPRGTPDGLGATQDRARYRFMRAMLGAQSLPLGPSRYEQIVESSWDTSRAVDTGAVKLELTPADFDITLGGGDDDILQVEASHIAACIRHIKDLQFEARHRPYLEGALGYSILQASEAWQVTQVALICRAERILPRLHARKSVRSVRRQFAGFRATAIGFRAAFYDLMIQ